MNTKKKASSWGGGAVSIQPCWPKSDSALPEKLHQKAIPAQGRAHFSPGTKSAPANWAVLTLIQGSQIRLYFTHRNGPIFRAETDFSDLQCTERLSYAIGLCLVTWKTTE